jgi:endogenous inhibitor of DNA gyrase (YacG/DUF329 family)
MPPAEPACPICGKPSLVRLAPFCSRRCADIDLGRWLKGGYAIAGRPEEGVESGSQAPSGMGPDPDEVPDG